MLFDHIPPIHLHVLLLTYLLSIKVEVLDLCTIFVNVIIFWSKSLILLIHYHWVVWPKQVMVESEILLDGLKLDRLMLVLRGIFKSDCFSFDDLRD